jgi:predicted transcriptional regulator
MTDKPTLGAQELEVLRFVSEHAPATVRDVSEQFGEQRGLARTTIQTMMERLRKKGYLIRTKGEEGTFQYSPGLAHNDLLLSLVQNFVERSLGGSVVPFLTYLSEQPDLNEDEVAELRRLLEALSLRNDVSPPLERERSLPGMNVRGPRQLSG